MTILKLLNFPIFFASLLLLILNPYSIIGALAYYAALPFVGLTAFFGMKYINKKIFYCFLGCIGISFFGFASSVMHDIAQIEHIKVSLSIFVYYFIGVGLFIGFRNKYDFDDLLLVSLFVGVFNGLIILLQVQLPQFRAIVESIFVGSGNIDWSDGFRYRGLASSGGASLSVLSAFMFYISLYLYDIGKVGALRAFAAITILLLSVFFIGRTGVLLIGVAIFMYMFIRGFISLRFIIFSAIISIIIVYFGLDYIKEFLIQAYGEGFYMYSFGLFLEGKQGIENEGTIGVITEFLMNVPSTFPEVLIGYGFYGGSHFYPWTDSGYARMFLSVGFVFGFSYYILMFYVFKKLTIGMKVLFWPLILILMIAETKEGLLFSGYSSRFLFILMGFWAAKKMQIRRASVHKKSSTAYIGNMFGLIQLNQPLLQCA